LLCPTLSIVFAAPAGQATTPGIQWTAHNQGNIQIAVSNRGCIGDGSSQTGGYRDPFTGDIVNWCIYPRESNYEYWLYLNPIVGATIGRDTLVDCDEFLPDVAPLSDFSYKTADPSRSHFDESARSELDIQCTYYDTTIRRDLVGYDGSGRDHIPLDLKVDQRSMAWSGENLGDFILVEYTITNQSDQTYNDMYVGWRHDCYAEHRDRRLTGDYRGAYCGFLDHLERKGACGIDDNVRTSWFANRDGHPENGLFNSMSPLGVLGVTLLGAPTDSFVLNYNWVVPFDAGLMWWHPQRRTTDGSPVRRFHYEDYAFLRDKDLYYLMSHPEVDYDLMTIAVDKQIDGWLPPPPDALDAARGDYPRVYLSCGPFKLGPGQTAPFTIAIVGGENFHHDPTAWDRLFDPYNPDRYYRQLDFSELARNVRTARAVYDNPGLDSDGDGYRGEYFLCNGDTVWTRGDGIPDFRADMPPSPPIVRVYTERGKLIIRWNGFFSETSVDPLTATRDFEGYRVYVGLDERSSSLTLMSSYDRQNYNRWTYTELANGESRWEQKEIPLTLDTLRVMYDDPDFEPLEHTRISPLEYEGTYYYFTAQDHNLSDLTDSEQIHRAYPDATFPGEDSTQWIQADLTLEHGRPLPKYWEYEYIVSDLLPTVPYYVAVTTFDFGFAVSGIPPRETNPSGNLQECYALESADEVLADNLDVFVYPNPYRIDGGYAEDGFEYRIRERSRERGRRIHFANLPPRCRISIFSIDGDLVRAIEHDFAPDDPEAMHETWDLITRNTMAAVTGLYYWVVESDTRTQMGKLVIIK